MVFIKHYRSAFYGRERVAVLHCAGDQHRVYIVSRGEYIGESREHIAFVVIRYGIREVKSVGDALRERLFECDDHVLSLNLSLRRLFLRRRQENVLLILYGDVFVEAEDNLCLVSIYVNCTRYRLSPVKRRRNGVFLSTRRCLRGVRTGMHEKGRGEHGKRRSQRYEYFP